jgi:ABC-2 type transport system permease protein
MNAVAAIFWREFRAYFYSPLAYVFGAAFLLAAGVGFYNVAVIFGRADAQPSPNPLAEVYFPLLLFILILVIPSITMRVLSEDLRSRSIELLLTAPVREGEVVAGKFLGAYAFYVTMLAASGAFAAMATHYAEPALDLGPVAAGYLGFLGSGAMLIALGCFVSAFCKNQIVAFVFTAVAVLLLQLLPNLQRLAESSEGFVASLGALAAYLSPASHFGDFVRGVVDLRPLVLYASVTAWFLFATTLVLGLRKAR